MSCLELAKKLANKSKTVNSTVMSPTVKRTQRQPSVKFAPSVNIENRAPNMVTESPKKPAKQVPFSRVFTDKNLFHYFEKYAWEKHLMPVLNFIDSCKKYKQKFPTSSQKQKEKHDKIMQQLGLLPQEYIMSTVNFHQQMCMISEDSFDECLSVVEEKLESNEYPAFINSPHFVKWTLKYYNTEME